MLICYKSCILILFPPTRMLKHNVGFTRNQAQLNSSVSEISFKEKLLLSVTIIIKLELELTSAISILPSLFSSKAFISNVLASIRAVGDTTLKRYNTQPMLYRSTLSKLLGTSQVTNFCKSSTRNKWKMLGQEKGCHVYKSAF